MQAEVREWLEEWDKKWEVLVEAKLSLSLSAELLSPHNFHSLPKIRLTTFQVYDAINDDVELPNIDYPDSDASKAIIEFHACEFSGTSKRIIVYLYFGLFS